MDVPGERRLLDFIREDLHLTGTKEGCGIGEVRRMYGAPESGSNSCLSGCCRAAPGRRIVDYRRSGKRRGTICASESFYGEKRRTMRLLHQRHDHVCESFADEKSASFR